MANWYHYGLGVEKDYERAIKLYTKSAKQNFVKAQHNLGFMYFELNEPYKDYKKSEYWLKQAVIGGDDEAKELLKDIWLYL